MVSERHLACAKLVDDAPEVFDFLDTLSTQGHNPEPDRLLTSSLDLILELLALNGILGSNVTAECKVEIVNKDVNSIKFICNDGAENDRGKIVPLYFFLLSVFDGLKLQTSSGTIDNGFEFHYIPDTLSSIVESAHVLRRCNNVTKINKHYSA